jgi:hypothetical protein
MFLMAWKLNLKSSSALNLELFVSLGAVWQSLVRDSFMQMFA